MRFGLDNNRERVLASPKETSSCPLCKEELIAKCGSIKVWHWSHKSKIDCDSWAEGETQWHLDWKYNFPKENQEVIMKECTSDYCNDEKYHAPCDHVDCVDCQFISHRADVKMDKKVIEFQNSSISPEEIEEREKFYGDMIWVLNGCKFANNLELRPKGDFLSFRWRYPPKSWWKSVKEIYIDLTPLVHNLQNKLRSWQEYEEKHLDSTYCNNEIREIKNDILTYKNNLFLIKKVYQSVPCGGWGYLISKEEFIKKVKGNDK